jgi:hypothetical protein
MGAEKIEKKYGNYHEENESDQIGGKVADT